MSYIENLINRFHSEEKLSERFGVFNQIDTVSQKAKREAAKINDIGYLDELREFYKKNKKWKYIVDLASICSSLIVNTKSAEAKEFYLQLKRKGASSTTMSFLIMGATRANLKEYAPIVREMMQTEVGTNNHYSSAIEYLAEVIGEPSVNEIGDSLDNDCYGRCNPFYCCFALQKINSVSALPYLERAIERNKKGRKQWQTDTVGYSMEAIEVITNSN
jgi:hypothetical protein